MRRVRINTEIYSRKCVNAAIIAYKDIADIKCLDNDSKSIECCFLNCKFDELLTTKEFCNYLIDVMNSVEMSE